MAKLFVLVLLCLFVTTNAETFPWMNDFIACAARMPIYGEKPTIMEKGSYKIRSDKTEFMPGDMITFYIDGKTQKDKYRGLFISVLEGDNAVGEWIPSKKFMRRSCHGASNSAMTEMSTDMKNVQCDGLQWQAPECQHDMNYEVVATVVKADKEFERNIRMTITCMNGMPEPSPEPERNPGKDDGDEKEKKKSSNPTPENAPGLPSNPFCDKEYEGESTSEPEPKPEGLINPFYGEPTGEPETNNWDDDKGYGRGEKEAEPEPEPENLPVRGPPKNPLFMAFVTTEPEPEASNWGYNDDAEKSNMGKQPITEPESSKPEGYIGNWEDKEKPEPEPSPENAGPPMNNLFMRAPITEPESSKPEGYDGNWEDNKEKPEPETSPENAGPPMNNLFMRAPITEPESSKPEGYDDNWEDKKQKPEPEPTPEIPGPPMNNLFMGAPITEPESSKPEGYDANWEDKKQKPEPEPTPEMPGPPMNNLFMVAPTTEPESVGPENEPEWKDGEEYKADGGKGTTPEPEPKPQAMTGNPKPLGIKALNKCKNRRYKIPAGASTSFENMGYGSWRNGTGGELMWLPISGKTPSPDTGPDGAYDGDNYIFMEGSRPSQMGDRAILRGPAGLRGCFCVQFMCHMNVDPKTTIHLLVDGKVTKSSRFSHMGWQMTQATVDKPGEVELEIVAIKGDTFRGDVAVDDVRVTPGVCEADDM